MASNCSQIGTSSALARETASITWVLDDFMYLSGHYESPEFSPTNNSKLSFGFGIWLKAKPFLDNVFIYLYPNQTNESMNIEYEVSILNSDNKKLYTRMFQCSFDDNFHYPYCFASLISRTRLIREANGFISDKKLILFCQVNVLNPDLNGPMSRLTKDFQTILEIGDFSDFTLKVGDKEFKVHKNILAARSEVFKAMFSADLKEKKQNRVEISDIEVEVFERLLAYIYSGGVQQMDEYALELFVAADKYQLDELKSHCVQSLISSLTIESVTNILLHADMHTAPELKSKCFKFINANSVQVMATDGWKQFIKANRIQLLAELYADKC